VNRLVHAELVKLRTTRSTTSTVLAGLAIAGLLGAVNAAIADEPGSAALGSSGFVEDVVAVSAVPAVFALLLGVLLSAGEYQHGTITTTFLVTARRQRVVAAKAVAAAIAGVVVAAAMAVVALLAALPAVLAEGASLHVLDADVGLAVVGLLGASALLGTGGALLGMLVRSQVATVVGIAAWVLIVESVLSIVVGEGLHRWLPGGAASALTGNGDLPMWGAAGILVAWIAAAAVVTVPVVTHRDVD
jgi:ABC-2 type transport system permease protein